MPGSVQVDAEAGAGKPLAAGGESVGRGYTATIGDGGGCAACIALPAAGRGRGVVVLAPSSGVAVAACERLAREGFVAVAPEVAPLETDAGDLGAARSAVDAAIEQLFREYATQGGSAGVLGLGRCAAFALDAAARDPRIAAAAALGAAPEADGDDFAAPRCDAPVLVILGEKDAAEDATRRLEERLREAGSRCDLRIQPGAAADFYDEEHADVYDPAAADAAWDAVLALLRAELA